MKATSLNKTQGVHRCFEKVFEDVQTYNNCTAASYIENPTANTNMPPPSVLDFPGQEGGVEQCDCTCNYMERQSPSEATTGLIYT